MRFWTRFALWVRYEKQPRRRGHERTRCLPVDTRRRGNGAKQPDKRAKGGSSFPYFLPRSPYPRWQALDRAPKKIGLHWQPRLKPCPTRPHPSSGPSIWPRPSASACGRRPVSAASASCPFRSLRILLLSLEVDEWAQATEIPLQRASIRMMFAK